MSSIDTTQDTIFYVDDTQEQTITELSSSAGGLLARFLQEQNLFDSEDYAHYQQYSLEKTIAKLKTTLSDILCRFEDQRQKIRQLKRENAKLQEERRIFAFAVESAEETMSNCGDNLNDELDALTAIMKSFADDAIWLKTLNEDTNTGVLKMVKGEIDKVTLAVQTLESVFLEKQKLLQACSKQNEELKERLITKKDMQSYNEKCGKAFGEGQQSPPPWIPQNTTYDNKASIIVDSFSLLLEDGNPLTIKFNEAGDLSNAMFCVEERQQYRLRIDLLVNRNVKELKYVHYFKKLRMRWFNREIPLEPLALQNDVQSIALPLQTAPQGLLRRGKYKVTSKLLGENDLEYAKWSWTLKIVKSTSSRKALVLH